MCSGCSDYYEGDDEQDASGYDLERWGQQGGPSAKGGAAVGRLGETPSKAIGRREPTWERDEYEILVSADCIIECRKISADGCTIDAPEPEGSGTSRDVQRERERCWSWSVKSYQTRRPHESRPRDGTSSTGMWLALCGLASAVALGLVLWLAVK
jgi:hypothetical protein